MVLKSIHHASRREVVAGRETGCEARIVGKEVATRELNLLSQQSTGFKKAKSRRGKCLGEY
jgi:hypothetical protein